MIHQRLKIWNFWKIEKNLSIGSKNWIKIEDLKNKNDFEFEIFIKKWTFCWSFTIPKLEGLQFDNRIRRSKFKKDGEEKNSEKTEKVKNSKRKEKNVFFSTFYPKKHFFSKLWCKKRRKFEKFGENSIFCLLGENWKNWAIRKAKKP